MARQIPLGQDRVAIVDDADFEVLSAFRWHLAQSRPRAPSYARRGGKGTPYVWMHRSILDGDPGQIVDHINGDGLDNRRENLRACTAKQNLWNARLRANNTSGYHGVSIERRSGLWMATIRVEDRRMLYIGSFADPADAARAWDAVALERRGEFARLNFPAEVSG